MKIAALIVTYKPYSVILQRNINSFIHQVDQLLIWDNTPGESYLGHSAFSFLKNPKIQIMGEGENRGMGYALNQGVGYATENEFSYLLTMDQDSYFSDASFAHLAQMLEALNNPLVAGVIPYACIQELTLPPKKEERGVIKTFNIITSGTVYAMAAVEKIGAFRSDFFIDAIDTEYTLRAKKNGYHFLQVHEALLQHQLGNIKMKSLGFRSIRCFNYSPLRCYYFARNHYIVCSSYPSVKRWLAYWKSFIFRNFSVALFEKNKRKKMSAYFRGLFDGVRHKTGICKRYHK